MVVVITLILVYNIQLKTALFNSPVNPLDMDNEGTRSEIAHVQTFHFLTPKYKSEIIEIVLLKYYKR